MSAAALPTLQLRRGDVCTELLTGSRVSVGRQMLEFLFLHATLPQAKHLHRVADFISGIAGVYTIEAHFSLVRGPLTSLDTSTANIVHNLAAFLNSIAQTSCINLLLKEDDMPHFLPYSLGSGNSQAPLPLAPVTTLRELFIKMPVMFTFAFRDWIVDSINASPLVALTVSAEGLGSETWNEVLTQLHPQHLRKLTLSLPEISYKDLCAFLSRLPTLTVLALRDSPASFVRGGALSQSGISLTSLRRLSCPPRALANLLGSTLEFPALSSITIHPESRQDGCSLKRWSAALRALGRRQFRHELELTLILGKRNHSFPEKGESDAIGLVRGVLEIILDLTFSPSLRDIVPHYLQAWLSPFSIPDVDNILLKGHGTRSSQLSDYMETTFPSAVVIFA